MNTRHYFLAGMVAMLALPLAAWAQNGSKNQQGSMNQQGSTNQESAIQQNIPSIKNQPQGQKLSSAQSQSTAHGGVGAGIGYNYVGGEVGYGHSDPDGHSTSNGLIFNIEGSKDFTPHFNLLGHYTHLLGDDVGIDQFAINGGVHTNLNSSLHFNAPFRLDAFANAGLAYLSVAPNHHGGDNHFGINLRGGLRTKITSRIEADGSVGIVYYGHQIGPVYQGVATYDLTRKLGVRALYRHYDLDNYDFDQAMLGIRYFY
jgi:hypothetical protein